MDQEQKEKNAEIGKAYEVLKKARIVKDLPEFAKMIGTSKSTLSRWNNGKGDFLEEVYTRAIKLKTETEKGLRKPLSLTWRDLLQQLGPEDIPEALRVLADVASKRPGGTQGPRSKEPDNEKNKSIQQDIRKGIEGGRGKTDKREQET